MDAWDALECPAAAEQPLAAHAAVDSWDAVAGSHVARPPLVAPARPAAVVVHEDGWDGLAVQAVAVAPLEPFVGVPAPVAPCVAVPAAVVPAAGVPAAPFRVRQLRGAFGGLLPQVLAASRLLCPSAVDIEPMPAPVPSPLALGVGDGAPIPATAASSEPGSPAPPVSVVPPGFADGAPAQPAPGDAVAPTCAGELAQRLAGTARAADCAQTCGRVMCEAVALMQHCKDDLVKNADAITVADHITTSPKPLTIGTVASTARELQVSVRTIGKTSGLLSYGTLLVSLRDVSLEPFLVNFMCNMWFDSFMSTCFGGHLHMVRPVFFKVLHRMRRAYNCLFK